ncbi:branched-chain amino acid ABC transporter substrate-binding protein [Iodobacter fluviatilis]|uniref:Amino acid/amide ABC transporter substrate-binding protein (HAAT family) n=1 Tax=Iodobacter fluviatilis TaxID=537 RepID=A0A377QA39_9NEIS|nr:branched-chain amino acid ABC transporter substrate-binding protein [Iodobacter fluviatilis]TCU81275.1 amino acid/amide ABC transporter substrate-binding protein (HAAT family) [Iodobacter fluviatilis]STQ91687.1 Leucine-, isoleucine-, valine-, threonine-, and alanine-binding protein precursor [Iodobacter fluviatilis]
MTIARYSLIAAAILTLGACGKQEAPKDVASQAAAETAQPAASNSGDTVKIAHSAPLTGNNAHFGKDNENGTRMAIDEVNAEGGADIGGKKVKFELVSEDDQADPKTATTVAQRFVDMKVAGIIGHMNSGTTIPASKIYADAGIPQISPSATAVAYTAQGFKSAFRVMSNDAQQGKVLGDFAVKKLAAKKVAIIDDRTAYGQGLADEFEKAAKAAGAEVVKREFTTNQETDFNAILTSIKGAKPDLVFYGGMDAQAAPLKKQAKKLGIAAKIMGGDGTQTPEFIKLAGADSEGMVSSSPGQSKESMPGGAEFLTKFKAKFGVDVNLYAPYNYDATKVMIEAMKKAGSVDPAKYLPELQKIEYKGVTGIISFDEKGDIKNGPITVYQVKGGKWEVIEVVAGEAK